MGNKPVNRFGLSSKPTTSGTMSCRALVAVALVTTGGVARQVFAADLDANNSGAAPLAAVPSTAQAGSEPATPATAGVAAKTYSIRPLLLPERYAPPAELAMNDAGMQVAQSGNASSPSSQTGPQQATPPVAGSGGGGGGISTYTIPPPPPQAQNPYALADQLKYRGWIVPIPGAADTLDQGLGGVRVSLAEQGISYFGFSSTTYQDNLLHHGHPPGVNSALAGNSKQEQYSGQLPTYTTADTLFLMYDLRRFGIPDGQVSFGGSLLQTNWNPGDPDGIGVAQISYYQTLFDRRVEFKAGYLTNNLEFLGTQVGGSISAGLFGVSAAIPFEVGQNLGSFPTPSVNVKVNLPDNIYTKVGVQRATSPDGLTVERLQNPTSVRFTVPNAGVFVIDETGYRVNAAPGQMSTWIRAAANYTSSRYTDIETGVRHSSNFGLYLLADRQIIQTAPNAGPGSAIRGVYAGISAMYAPSYFNPFSQYYEARLYGLGLIPGRPFDFTSLVYNRNVFSPDFRHLAASFFEPVHTGANTITGSYSAHVFHGINVNFGVSYTDHPSPIVYSSNTGSSLSVLTNLFVWF